MINADAFQPVQGGNTVRKQEKGERRKWYKFSLDSLVSELQPPFFFFFISSALPEIEPNCPDSALPSC